MRQPLFCRANHVSRSCKSGSPVSHRCLAGSPRASPYRYGDAAPTDMDDISLPSAGICFSNVLIRKFLVIADDADFRFQVDTVRFFDAFLDFVDDVEDIPCRRMACIDDEASVFL